MLGSRGARDIAHCHRLREVSEGGTGFPRRAGLARSFPLSLAAEFCVPRFADLPQLQELRRAAALHGGPLIDLVPEQRREAHFPCRHILLTPRGETVNRFCQWGTEEELETALRAWLERSIREMEA